MPYNWHGLYNIKIRHDAMKSSDKFIRDINNQGAVINTDNGALNAYKLQKKKNKEIDNLKQEVTDIKNMLHLILEKLNK